MTTPPPEMMTGKRAVASSSTASFETLLAARAAVQALGLGNLGLDLAVEVVARDVQLRGAHLGHCAVKAPSGEFGHAGGVGDVALIFGELLEHRQLPGFLKAAQADAHGAGFRRDDHHGLWAQ